MRSTTLASSPGWKLSGPKWTHTREPPISSPDAGHEREQEQADAAEARRGSGSGRGRGPGGTTTRVAMNAAMPSAVHTACRPACVAVEPGDHHVAEPVEQPGDRQQDRVGAWGEDAQRDVADDEQTEHDDEERAEVDRQRRRLAEAGQDVRADRR